MSAVPRSAQKADYSSTRFPGRLKEAQNGAFSVLFQRKSAGKHHADALSRANPGPPNPDIPDRNRQKRVKHTSGCFSNGKVHRSGLRTDPPKTYREIPRFQLGISEMEKR